MHQVVKWGFGAGILGGICAAGGMEMQKSSGSRYAEA